MHLHVDQLLGNDRETNYATARKLQQRNGVFYAVRAEML
jgi:hypothetical protein